MNIENYIRIGTLLFLLFLFLCMIMISYIGQKKEIISKKKGALLIISTSIFFSLLYFLFIYIVDKFK